MSSVQFEIQMSAAREGGEPRCHMQKKADKGRGLGKHVLSAKVLYGQH